MKKAPTRPLLRYQGSKWLLARKLIPHFPEHRIFVSPFGGSWGEVLRKPRSFMEVWNDVDGELVNLFRVLRDSPGALLQGVALTPYARAELDLSLSETPCPIEKARRTLVRFQMSMDNTGGKRGSSFRISRIGGAKPAMDWARYPQALGLIIERLRGAAIESQDFRMVVERYDSPETFFFADPPYLPETRSRYAKYKNELSIQDHQDLAAVLATIQGKVMVCGYRSQLYERLYPGWRTMDFAARSLVGARVETVWMNYEPPQATLPGV